MIDDPYAIPEPKKEQGIAEIPANGISLDFLQAIYRDSSLPLPTRMRAAIYCLPFETPKLLATAIVQEGSLAELLDARLKRISEMKLLENKTINGEQVITQPITEPPPTSTAPLPSPLSKFYSPRFKRRF
jgi:hypothetical protein